MSESAPETYTFRVNAELLAPGQKLVPGDGPAAPLAPVAGTSVEEDDFGTPALVIVKLEDGSSLRLAHGSSVRVQAPAPEGAPSDAVRQVPSEEDNAAEIIAEAAAAHPGHAAVQEIAGRLERGLNVKSGSNLQDVRDLAYLLFVDLGDSGNALKVCNVITGLPFDGNFGRWNWIQGALSLAAHITHEAGDDESAAAYSQAVRAADATETDPLRAKVAAELLQRQLNEPNLYDREIHRAAEAGNEDSEKEWRVLRLNALLYLRAHGGSQTLTDAEIDRRIQTELIAVRG
ncbi:MULTISPECIES: DUF6707 family protein [unclassified Arthrobacter]|uniref:DUF6707 family protein n=1 Tax=unclassified Arthrobacter TaxID=235627 RepID=UPI001D139BCB|nr:MULTISPECIES: DUF6707 family protein [unclassified Arthrobacter]MCC3276324.1 hypothetical protein [Arthrobacter sp. zg-Y20]MCC3280373.1 hypothetical protein [Arthrobacter sp. zg-Y40]MCC9178648.1 hypothetical protein [Arthrobacter sp. zg-Y750]MDK1316483.1 hypothetical protein [Arthrobacter sp. zg.Y20]MDK1328686.1 hypothetical protein [Arthrobacter sp. zg-Y1143]